MLEGALGTDADAVVFDLEDAVSPADSADARATVVSVLDGIDIDDGPEVLVRVNELEVGGRDDIEALGSLEASAPAGVVLPKVDDAATVGGYRSLIREADLDASLWCLIESPEGLLEAPSVAWSTGVTAVIFGGEDYMAAVGGERTASNTELLYARQHVVAAASAAGVDAIDGITADFEDLDRVRSDAEEAATFGFDGKLAIHPAQLEPINEAFTPDPERIEWARRVITAAESTDRGVFSVDGEMIDAPLIARARSILDRIDE